MRAGQKGAVAVAGDKPKTGDLSEAQRAHWQETYRRHPGMYGAQPSAPAQYAADHFEVAGVRRVLELGCGHGRDARSRLGGGRGTPRR